MELPKTFRGLPKAFGNSPRLWGSIPKAFGNPQGFVIQLSEFGFVFELVAVVRLQVVRANQGFSQVRGVAADCVRVRRGVMH